MFKRKKHEKIEKSTAEIAAWLETHGIDRNTAAQLDGFLRAKEIKLPQYRLCTYGLTYTIDEFIQWYNKPSDDFSFSENSVCVLWNNENAKAIVGVLSEIKTATDDGEDGIYVASNGETYKRCCLFENLAQYRQILNTPDDMEIALPHLVHEEAKTNPEKEEIPEEEEDNSEN